MLVRCFGLRAYTFDRCDHESIIARKILERVVGRNQFSLVARQLGNFALHPVLERVELREVRVCVILEVGLVCGIEFDQLIANDFRRLLHIAYAVPPMRILDRAALFAFARFHFERGKLITHLEQVRFPAGGFLQFVQIIFHVLAGDEN